MPRPRRGEPAGEGCELLDPVSALSLWARKNRPCIEEARSRFDVAEGKRKSA